MLIRLESVQESPFQWDETVDLAGSVDQLPELTRLGPVSWRGELVYADPDYYLTASFEYEQVLACVRCLGDVPDRIRGDLQLLLTREMVPREAAEVALKEEELGCVYLQADEIELNEFLEEQVALGIPMKPQCRPDCQGLCSECGANLNDGSCGCETETVDPRWQALAGIRDRLDENR